MLYSCALIFFLCCSGCLLTISLFSDRWMLVEVALKQTDKIKVTTYVTIGLWETRRVRFYHYYHHYHPFYHHHHHGVLVYHEGHHVPIPPPAPAQLPPAAPPPPTPAARPPTPAPLATAAAPQPAAKLQLSYTTAFASRLTEKTLLHLAEAASGALIAIRVLLFICVGLAFGALILLLVTACNDTSVIRHRYKEKKLAFTMAGLCGIALLLTIISWSVFLGTIHRSVQSYSNGSDTLNAGFVCCVLASICLVVSIIMAACTVDENL